MTDAFERTPAEIEEDIARTRSDMGRTLNALQKKLSPGQMVDEVLTQLGNGSGEFAGGLGRAIRANPVPVTLMGIGLGWLMVSAGTGRREGAEGNGAVAVRRRGIKTEGPADGTPDEKKSGVGSGVRDMAKGLRDKVGGLRDGATHMSGRARGRAGQAGGNVRRVVNEKPLLLGALGVAMGLTIGALLPVTRRENALLGETRDRLKDKAMESGNRRLGEVGQVVDAAVRSAQEEAGRRGMIPQSDDKPEDRRSTNPADDRTPKPEPALTLGQEQR